jgi:hypothetical protein
VIRQPKDAKKYGNLFLSGKASDEEKAKVLELLKQLDD